MLASVGQLLIITLIMIVDIDNSHIDIKFDYTIIIKTQILAIVYAYSMLQPLDTYIYCELVKVVQGTIQMPVLQV